MAVRLDVARAFMKDDRLFRQMAADKNLDPSLRAYARAYVEYNRKRPLRPGLPPLGLKELDESLALYRRQRQKRSGA